MKAQVRDLAEARETVRRPARSTDSATQALADAIDRATARLGPAADAIVGFETRLEALCLWLKKWGPWGLASVPVVLSLVQGVSPQLAELIGHIIKAATS